MSRRKLACQSLTRINQCLQGGRSIGTAMMLVQAMADNRRARGGKSAHAKSVGEWMRGGGWMVFAWFCAVRWNLQSDRSVLKHAFIECLWGAWRAVNTRSQPHLRLGARSARCRAGLGPGLERLCQGLERLTRRSKRLLHVFKVSRHAVLGLAVLYGPSQDLARPAHSVAAGVRCEVSRPMQQP